MKKIILLLALLLNLSGFQNPKGFCQSPKIDSLQNILKTAKHDTVKINMLNMLSQQFWRRGDYEQAMQYAKDALHLFRSSKTLEKLFPKSLTTTYSNIGIIHSLKGDYNQSLEFHLKGLKISEEIGDKVGMSGSYNNIGIIYRNKGDYGKALEFYFKALKIFEELNDKRGLALAYNNIGIIYRNKNDYDKALEFYLKSLKVNEEKNDKQGMAMSYNNIGNVYLNKNDYDKALEFYLKALKIREELGDKKGLAMVYNNISDLLLKQGKIAEAKKQSLISLNIAKTIGAKGDIGQAYYVLSLCDSAAGNWKGAYEYHQMYSEIKDSIFNEESSKQITEMQTKYDTEKKEQQIKLLNKDKEIQSKDLQRQKTIRNAVAGGLMLVLLFSFVLINRLLLIRKQKKVIEIEREKSEKLLLNILPKETADELKLKNAVTPKRYEQVTVMFTDFKGFTTIAEKMSAEELVSELDFIFKKFDEIISKYPIEKIKIIGDAYMCAGGLPTPNESNPMDVVLAALEIQEFMEKLAISSFQLANEDKETPKLQTANWKLRIGIHTGSVIAGVVGDKKFAYDIWGDTVNTASRMESSGEAGKVNISGSTYKHLVGATDSVAPTESPLRFTFRGKIPAKNKGEIEMYFVERK